MTPSLKFAALDRKEAERLAMLSTQDMAAFSQMRHDYVTECRPCNDVEQDMVFTLVDIRWVIDRYSIVCTALEDAIDHLGYESLKMKAALNEAIEYRRELQDRYKGTLSELVKQQKTRCAVGTPYCEAS